MKLPFGLRMAKLACARSQYGVRGKRIGSAWIDKTRVVIASNEIKTSPALVRLGYPSFATLHAEMQLFARVVPPVEGDVYVFRQHADGSLALAKPCDCCREMLQTYGIKWVCYTINNDFKWEKI